MKRLLTMIVWGLLLQNVSAQLHPFAKANWITPGFSADTLDRPCTVFSRGVSIGKAVLSAKLYVTAHGLYEAAINQHKVGDAFFTPGFTSYHKRLQYQVYGVKALLKPGRNELSFTVADGWYRGVFGGDLLNNRYGRDAALLAQLVIIYSDGTKETIISDKRWRWSTGPVRGVNFYGGETQDARIKPVGRARVSVQEYPKNNLVPTSAEPVTGHEQFMPKRFFVTPKGEQVIDFGQNMAGFVRVKVKGKRGDTIRVCHAEALDSAGNFYTGNLREALAEDVYVLRGSGTETFEPHFTYHGFRYVKVMGYPGRLKRSNFKAVALYSGFKQTGSFSCADPLINRLQKNIVWSLKSNFVDIPTDCPQRSERYGWTGDAQVFCSTAAFNRDVKNFFGKWLADLAADQGRNGVVPNVVPCFPDPDQKRLKAGVAGWGDAVTIIPWTMYEVYGDTAVLSRQYVSMKAWVDYVRSVSKDDRWTANGYGDWYAQGDSTSLHYIDQCFYAHSVELLLKTAKVLHRERDTAEYAGLLEKVKRAFLASFTLGSTKATGTQTAYVLALQFDLLPDSQRKKAAAQLVERIHANDDHLATGFLGTPYLLPVLSRFGYDDLAFKLLKQRTMPSWLYPVTKGATTIWEKWDAIRPDGSLDTCSLNHYAYGAVGDWLYRFLAGIDAAAPGYKKIRIQPHFGGGLNWVKANYRSPYGTIVSNWTAKNHRYEICISVPKGTTAEICLPDKGIRKLPAGKYRFSGTFQGITNRTKNKQ